MALQWRYLQHMQKPWTSFTSQPSQLFMHANVINQSAKEQTTLTISSWNVIQEVVASFRAIFTPKNLREPLVMGIAIHPVQGWISSR